jgi:hypothetical protein
MTNIKRMMTKATLSAGALCAVVCSTAIANAEPRTHDGFYLQMDVGLGYLSSSAEDQGIKATYTGLTIPSALMLGGTIGPVVLGGGFFGDYAPAPGAEIGGVSGDLQDVTLTLVGIGMFADIYPDIHGGLHFQPFIGYGGLESSYKGDSGGSDPLGPVFAFGAGYDWWVASEWSIGVMGRVAYAPLTLDSVSYSTVAPAVLATFTYH